MSLHLHLPAAWQPDALVIAVRAICRANLAIPEISGVARPVRRDRRFCYMNTVSLSAIRGGATPEEVLRSMRTQLGWAVRNINPIGYMVAGVDVYQMTDRPNAIDVVSEVYLIQ